VEQPPVVVAALASRLGSERALAAVERTLASIGTVPADERRRLDPALYRNMAKLVVSCRNDPAAALELRLRGDGLHRARFPNAGPKDYSWWPKKEQFRAR